MYIWWRITLISMGTRILEVWAFLDISARHDYCMVLQFSNIAMELDPGHVTSLD